MKNYTFLLLIVFVVTSGMVMHREDESESAADDSLFYAVQYLKAHPTSENDYVKLEIDVWKKLHQARKDAGLLDGWFLYRVVAPRGTDAAYNYVTVNVYSSKEKLAGHFEGYGVDYSKILTAEEIAVALKTDGMRDMVNEEVWQLQDNIPNKTGKVHTYQVVNSMRLKPGGTGDKYLRLETDTWKPIHEARIADGTMHSWGIYSLVLPRGTDVSYTWSTVDFYDKFVDVLENIDPYIAQAHIKSEVQEIMDNTLSTRDLLQSEVRVLLDYVK